MSGFAKTTFIVSVGTTDAFYSTALAPLLQGEVRSGANLLRLHEDQVRRALIAESLVASRREDVPRTEKDWRNCEVRSRDRRVTDIR
jgi:hypothetical protein